MCCQPMDACLHAHKSFLSSASSLSLESISLTPDRSKSLHLSQTCTCLFKSKTFRLKRLSLDVDDKARYALLS